ncbi:hypothetical protein Tco_0645752 [Tanacetum coccineum]
MPSQPSCAITTSTDTTPPPSHRRPYHPHTTAVTTPSPPPRPPHSCHHLHPVNKAENTTKVVFGWVNITTAAPQGVGLVANLSSFLDLGYPTEKHAQIGVFVSAFYCQTGVFGLLVIFFL